MTSNLKQLTAGAMLCALAYAFVALGRVPVVLFLKYDPKDVVIALGGLLMGPWTAAAVSCVVSLLEMVTISETGPLGCLMNILSTCSFACTAAVICRRRPSQARVGLGLLAGCGVVVPVMLLWNYLVTPYYMGYPREAVAQLLLPAFLPFNLLKAGLNASFTFLLFRPVSRALARAGWSSPGAEAAPEGRGPVLAAGAAALTCVLLVCAWNGLL